MADIDRDEFCSFIAELIKASLPLSLFHFALDVDNILSPLLPNRDEHITALVKQAFKISVNPSQLKHYLPIFKKSACCEILIIWHTKDTKTELAQYEMKEITDLKDAPPQYCSSIQIEPPSSICPK